MFFLGFTICWHIIVVTSMILCVSAVLFVTSLISDLIYFGSLSFSLDESS